MEPEQSTPSAAQRKPDSDTETTPGSSSYDPSKLLSNMPRPQRTAAATSTETPPASPRETFDEIAARVIAQSQQTTETPTDQIKDEEIIDMVQGSDGKWTTKPEKTAGRLKNIKTATKELAGRIDGVQLFGLHLTDFFVGTAIGMTSRTLAKGALIAATGGAGYGGAMIAGGISGALTGATREYIRQVRENIKEAQVAPGSEQRKLRLKEKLRVKNKGKLIVATGKGAIMGALGGFAGSYVLEHGGEWLDYLKQLAENRPSSGLVETASILPLLRQPSLPPPLIHLFRQDYPPLLPH